MFGAASRNSVAKMDPSNSNFVRAAARLSNERWRIRKADRQWTDRSYALAPPKGEHHLNGMAISWGGCDVPEIPFAAAIGGAKAGAASCFSAAATLISIMNADLPALPPVPSRCIHTSFSALSYPISWNMFT
jgi:hypothetical protein